MKYNNNLIGIQMKDIYMIGLLIGMVVMIMMPITYSQSIGLTLDTYTINANAKY